jgi:hypothetical protein
MITTNFLLTEMNKLMEATKSCISHVGGVTPSAFLYSAEGVQPIRDISFSDRALARQIIREQVARTQAEMVLICRAGWKGNDDAGTCASRSKDLQQVLLVYGETADQALVMAEEFDFNPSGKVVFRSLSIASDKCLQRIDGALTSLEV